MTVWADEPEMNPNRPTPPVAKLTLEQGARWELRVTEPIKRDDLDDAPGANWQI